MIRISTVIITLNEADKIEKCLNSILKISNEIIVVDSFSTDQTEEICEKYGVRFYKNMFINYSDQKNFGNRLANHEYILSIDADEALSETLKKSILEVKEQPLYAAYKFNRLNNYCGKWIHHCGWYPDTQVRLWKKDKGSWLGAIHEKLILTDGQIGKLKGNLLHFTYRSIHQHLFKINQYSSLIAQEKHLRRGKYTFIKLVFSPILIFIKKYFLKLGFLDGYYGFVICIMSSYYAFLKYAKLKELQKFRVKSDHTSRFKIF